MRRTNSISRGQCTIALDRVKDSANLGGVLRAAGCFGASLVVVGGGRLGKYATDTMRAYRHIPAIETDDVMACVPFGATIVVVELVERAKPLEKFTHPESAYYIFGPEDGNVRREIVERAPCVVKVNSGCLNLAAAVNIVLYDRQAKREA